MPVCEYVTNIVHRIVQAFAYGNIHINLHLLYAEKKEKQKKKPILWNKIMDSGNYVQGNIHLVELCQTV